MNGPCGVTMRQPSIETAAMKKVRARESIVEGGRGYETPEPPPPNASKKRQPSPPTESPSRPSSVLSPRCCIVPVPDKAKEKFLDEGRVIQLEDGTQITLNSPRILEASRRTGVLIEQVQPLKVGDFILAAKREGGKTDEQATRVGTRRFNMHELLRQGYLAELLACHDTLAEIVPLKPPTATNSGGAAEEEEVAGQPKSFEDVQNLTANMEAEKQEAASSSAIKAQEEIRKKTLEIAQTRFEQQKQRLEQEELDKEAARAKVAEIRDAYFKQKQQATAELQDKRNKAFDNNFKAMIKLQEDRKAATAQAKLDEVARKQAEAADTAKRAKQEEEFMANNLAFNRQHVDRVKQTHETWKQSKETQIAAQLAADAEAAKAAVVVAERLQRQHQRIVEKQAEKARVREERRQRALAAKERAVQHQILAQTQKLAKLDARLSARDNGAEKELRAKRRNDSERAERRKRHLEEQKAMRLAQAEEEDARRARAIVRREEVLEVRAEGSRLERELKAAQVAKQERIREHEWHLAIEKTEEKHRRLDQGIQAKEEFKFAQGVLAQEFFKQKLKLKTEQEKQWNKFNKMSITELQEHAARGSDTEGKQLSSEELDALDERIAAMQDAMNRLAQPTRPREKVPRDQVHLRGDNPHQGTWQYSVGAASSGARMNFYAA